VVNGPRAEGRADIPAERVPNSHQWPRRPRNKGDLIGLQAFTAKLVAINQRLTNPKVTEQTRKAQTEAPENISHYQAVNIEHVFSEEEEEGDRRIEIRDIPTQAGAAMLERDIGALLDVVQRLRDSVKASLRERITKPKKRR
jgi:hypothetical protein